MKVIIDISEESYKYIKTLSDLGWSTSPEYTNAIRLTASEYANAIKNGTPLPKGHGRIGDLDALREEVSSWGMNDYEPSDFTDAIDQADAIIEADKESEVGNESKRFNTGIK